MYGTIYKASDFTLASVELQFIAKKYVPEDSLDYEFLLGLSESLNQVYLLHHALKRIHDHIDRIHSITVPDERTVLHSSLCLAKISETRTTWNDHEGAKTAKQASELLHIWYDLYLNLNQLMNVSKEFRAACVRPAGNA